MLKKILFKAGSSASQPPLAFDLEPSVTIFVGPNNAGKTTALAELQSSLRPQARGTIIDRVEIQPMNADALDAFISKYSSLTQKDELQIPTEGGLSVATGKAITNHLLEGPNFDQSIYFEYFASRKIRFLSGYNRTNLLQAQPRNDLLNPSSEFGRLLMEPTKSENLRKIVAEELGLHIGFDALSQGAEIHMLFGKTPPSCEGSLSKDFMEWRQAARSIEQVSDGVRAFVGILLKLTVGDPDLFLIDEPEAFLHPTLAHRLGRELAKGAVSENKYVFAATHSAHFLMGAIQSGAKVNIVRLTYRNDIATARLLPNSALRSFMNDPMLRSVGVLDGLFFEHVVVTEADADRAFYSEINHRLLHANDPRGIPNALFLNADNKQTVPTIVKALRQVGIPTAAIIDIDLIVDEWNVVSKQLDACGYPLQAREGLSSQCKAVLKSLETASEGNTIKDKRNYFKSSKGMGAAVLTSQAEREAADNLFDAFDQYGCFSVRCGELENWLLDLPSVSRKKKGDTSFRAKIFEAMGSDPIAPNYVKPTEGDVWDFIGKIKTWLVNPMRRGIPE
jgi:ABC-type cobalamin/Fe3+-siderophores transport system ATPase subunit